MASKLTRKRVAILSDSERLARAVELNLRGYPDAECVKLTRSSPPRGSRPSWDTFDLVILATGLLTTDPVAMLDDLLPGRKGGVPLLLISNEPSRTDWGGDVYCLNFPFQADEFHRQVKGILSGSPERARQGVEERV